MFVLPKIPLNLKYIAIKYIAKFGKIATLKWTADKFSYIDFSKNKKKSNPL